MAETAESRSQDSLPTTTVTGLRSVSASCKSSKWKNKSFRYKQAQPAFLSTVQFSFIFRKVQRSSSFHIFKCVTHGWNWKSLSKSKFILPAKKSEDFKGMLGYGFFPWPRSLTYMRSWKTSFFLIICSMLIFCQMAISLNIQLCKKCNF